jgi:hypothetical protein
MINFKELFKVENQNKTINIFKEQINNLSKEEFTKYSNFIDKDGNTLLHHALNNKCFSLADFFFKNKIGTNIINNSGQEVLHTISNGSILKHTVESNTNQDQSVRSNSLSDPNSVSDSFSNLENANNYNDIQSDTELKKSVFSEKKNIPLTQKIELSIEKQTGGNSIKETIKYTKNKKDKYIEQGKKLIEYTQNIKNHSLNLQKIGKIYSLNLDKPNDILFAKYKQAGLYDYITNKYPNLIQKDMIKLLNFNINKEILDGIDPIRIKKKIMKCFKILKH